MSAQTEQWRVSTYEGTFETDLQTLRQWIRERAVLPTDKVSKGNLNWIDAGRVPGGGALALAVHPAIGATTGIAIRKNRPWRNCAYPPQFSTAATLAALV